MRSWLPYVVGLLLIAIWAIPALGSDGPISEVSQVVGDSGLTWPLALVVIARELRKGMEQVAKELHTAASELATSIKDWKPGTVKVRIERQDLDAWDGHVDRRLQRAAAVAP